MHNYCANVFIFLYSFFPFLYFLLPGDYDPSSDLALLRYIFSFQFFKKAFWVF